MDSILLSVKKMLGIAEEYTSFDQDIIMHINSAFFILNQLGVGTDKFSITDDSAVWTDFIDIENLELIRSYVYLKVRMLFDPPQAGALSEAMKRSIDEFEWRINVEVDPRREE